MTSSDLLKRNLLPTPTEVAGVGFLIAVCLCVCFIPRDISKTDAAEITKLDTRWVLKSHLFGGQKVKGQDYESQPAWVFALLWVLASSSCTIVQRLITVTDSLR